MVFGFLFIEVKVLLCFGGGILMCELVFELRCDVFNVIGIVDRLEICGFVVCELYFGDWCVKCFVFMFEGECV